MEEINYQSLRKFNIKMGLMHFIQASLMLGAALMIAKIADFKIPLFSNFLKFDQASLSLVTDTKQIGEAPFAIMVAMFLFLSSLFHFIISSKKFFPLYKANLEARINPFRWYEYALSSSLMIILIAMLFGVYDIGSLILMFTLNATMNLFGLVMEKINSKQSKLDWSSFIYGSIAGLVCWIVVILYAFGNSNPAEVPWFVYAIFVSYFIFFNLFPINMYLQYKKIGKWENYLYGERVYIILSLVAKSFLAWLVFFGVMQP